MRRRRAPNRLDTDFAEADPANVAIPHQLADRADRVFDRHVAVESRRTVDVDVIDAEPLEGIREKVLHGSRSRVVSNEGARRVSHAAELDAEHDIVAPPLRERVTDEQLVVPLTVKVPGVE